MRRMNAAERRVTYAEMLEWPDDGRRYELYDGEVVVVPAPVLRHQRVALHLMGLLRDYEESRGGIVVPAPFDIVFSQQNVVEPDVVYFRPERQHLLNPSSAAYVAPDLAVEVLSPNTERRDRGRKMELLARFGVPEYWIVDPTRSTLEILVLRGGAYTLTVSARDDNRSIASPTLDGLTIDTTRVFAD
ncbi:MAG: Uma2 family endonuclease [Acidobacteria bacterium]|nr:Uma2 family endonuclease [Acidobacteriota bacterium]